MILCTPVVSVVMFPLWFKHVFIWIYCYFFWVVWLKVCQFCFFSKKQILVSLRVYFILFFLACISFMPAQIFVTSSLVLILDFLLLNLSSFLQFSHCILQSSISAYIFKYVLFKLLILLYYFPNFKTCLCSLVVLWASLEQFIWIICQKSHVCISLGSICWMFSCVYLVVSCFSASWLPQLWIYMCTFEEALHLFQTLWVTLAKIELYLWVEAHWNMMVTRS